MLSFNIFLLGLIIISTITGLVTEAVKKILVEYNVKYRANTLVGVIATILSTALGVGYSIFTSATFDAKLVLSIIALVFLGWLCAMVGYDKVIQAINQFKVSKKERV